MFTYRFKTPYANDNLIDGSALSADDFSFANILEESSSRNCKNLIIYFFIGNHTDYRFYFV